MLYHRYPRPMRSWEISKLDEWESQDVVAIDRNGNLTLIEKPNGSLDWRAHTSWRRPNK